MKTELIFLNIAKKDLEAAKYLYRKKLYPQSVFYLQQAIEKATKSFGILNKIITETEAKNAIRHKAWKIYSKVLGETRGKVARLEETLKIFPKLKEVKLIKNFKPDSLKKKLDKYQRAFPDESETWNISFSKRELKSVIAEIDKLRDNLKGEIIRVDKKEVKYYKKKLYELLDALSEINPTNIEEAKTEIDKMIAPKLFANLLKKLSKPIFSVVFCSLSLFYLSLIFSPHAIKSRYPQDNFDPLEVYNEKLPLIQTLSSFTKITEETLEKLNYIYTEMPRNKVRQ